jgi:hypothetical protein
MRHPVEEEDEEDEEDDETADYDEDEEEEEEEEEDHECEIRCVTDGTCCCDFGAPVAAPEPKAEKPRHALGTYYINGVKYVPDENEYAGVPDLFPLPPTHERINTPIPTTPIRTARERHVPHAPPRLQRTATEGGARVQRTMTEDGERVHTFFS